MLIRIAWRNIWRNKRRALIVISSVVVGIIAIVLTDGLSNGMINQMLFNQINLNVAHIQIHKKGFINDKIVKDFIPDDEKVSTVLNNDPYIKAYSRRVIAEGILSSANNSSAVEIYGIIPGEEQKVSIIKDQIIEGTYPGKGTQEIALGKKLADKLGITIGDKVVAMTNTFKGDIGTDVFRVTGIFSTASSDFDKMIVYVAVGSLQNLTNLGDRYNEYAVLLKEYSMVAEVQRDLVKKLGSDYEVLSYRDLLPMLIYQVDLYKETFMILDIIVGLALIFGIINVMQMAVFERINEFGVLMSIGMNNKKIFGMIVTEGLFIGILGTFAGLILGILINIPLSHSGINLGFFSAGLESFGIGRIIYPELSIINLINTVLFIPFVAAAGAVYPAYRTIKFEPVFALNYV